MLNCVFHPIDDMRVVDDEERERLLATGSWFDSPLKAKALRDKHEERAVEDMKSEKPKRVKVKKE